MEGEAERAFTWQTLADELDDWQRLGRVATFWWRDDDAAEPCPALERLLRLTSAAELPLALAVVPGLLQPGVDALVDEAPLVRVLQHGWDHTNHAAGRKDRRASEICLTRGIEVVMGELCAGLARLRASFPGRVVPVLVPPWNRIDPAIVTALPAAGYTGLSTFGPRAEAMPAPGLTQINAHCDPVKWKQGRRFAGRSACLRAVIAQLRAGRVAPAGEAEPVGLLTHHRDFDAEAWRFTGELIRRVADHPAATFATADQLFAAR